MWLRRPAAGRPRSVSLRVRMSPMQNFTHLRLAPPQRFHHRPQLPPLRRSRLRLPPLPLLRLRPRTPARLHLHPPSPEAMADRRAATSVPPATNAAFARPPIGSPPPSATKSRTASLSTPFLDRLKTQDARRKTQDARRKTRTRDFIGGLWRHANESLVTAPL